MKYIINRIKGDLERQKIHLEGQTLLEQWFGLFAFFILGLVIIGIGKIAHYSIDLIFSVIG